jgi:hypothetical protein
LLPRLDRGYRQKFKPGDLLSDISKAFERPHEILDSDCGVFRPETTAHQVVPCLRSVLLGKRGSAWPKPPTELTATPLPAAGTASSIPS